MMNEVTWKLIKIASDHNINVQWSGLLSQFTPPACRLDTRNVLMNLNWHRPEEISFQLAHEISHIINGDPEDEFFTTPHSLVTDRLSTKPMWVQ